MEPFTLLFRYHVCYQVDTLGYLRAFTDVWLIGRLSSGYAVSSPITYQAISISFRAIMVVNPLCELRGRLFMAFERLPGADLRLLPVAKRAFPFGDRYKNVRQNRL